MLKLACELAMNLHPLDVILESHKLTPSQWDEINRNPQFQKILQSETEAWNSAINTHDRTRLKAAALIEMWLVEANQRLHDAKESLAAKTELGKLIARIAEMGIGKGAIEGGGERFSVTINLGADAQLKFDKPIPKIIDAVPLERSE